MKKPRVIYYYMEGCPYCEKTNPQWEYLKSRGYPYEFIKIERDQIPSQLSDKIRGFPQFHIVEAGRTRVVQGSRDSNEELEQALKLRRGKAYGGRLRTRRRRRTVRK
jgi:glutaredoxin